MQDLTTPIHFPASIHFQVTTEARPSTLPEAGLGIFSLEAVPAGTFLGMDFLKSSWVTTAEHIDQQPEEIGKFGWRHISDICFLVDNGEKAPTDFMNHSFEPNILWHVGHYFAIRDIAAGDELFMDYRHMLDPSWGVQWKDAVSGQHVVGFSWRESLAKSSQVLAGLLSKGSETDDR